MFPRRTRKIFIREQSLAKDEAPQEVEPDVPRGTQPFKGSELAQSKQCQPPLITLEMLPAHLPPPSGSLGAAGEEGALNSQWPQRLLIKES